MTACAIFIWALALNGAATQAAQTITVSPAAKAALDNPPNNLPENIRSELETAWKALAEPLIGRILNDSQAKTGFKVTSGTFQAKSYILFSAEGRAENSRRRVLIEIYRGAEEKIEQEYGRWFKPVRMGDMTIRSVEFHGDRAVYCTMTEDGTQAMYWQDGEIYFKVNSPDQIRSFAVQGHTRPSPPTFMPSQIPCQRILLLLSPIPVMAISLLFRPVSPA